jgi:DtxR family manganese transport transcriptional regulator
MESMERNRSKPFKATREHHGLEAAEDYTELILDLTESKESARTTDIAECLGISHVTALRTIRRLQEEGFVETSRGKPVVLTAKGKKLALYARERHQTLVEFFVALGVPKQVAEIDAEGAEHHISKITLGKMLEFLQDSKS